MIAGPAAKPGPAGAASGSGTETGAAVTAGGGGVEGIPAGGARARGPGGAPARGPGGALAGSTRRRDGSDPFNEAFSFASLEIYLQFRAVHPELFDAQASAGERRRRWIAFAQTTEGQALRWR